MVSIYISHYNRYESTFVCSSKQIAENVQAVYHCILSIMRPSEFAYFQDSRGWWLVRSRQPGGAGGRRRRGPASSYKEDKMLWFQLLPYVWLICLEVDSTRLVLVVSSRFSPQWSSSPHKLLVGNFAATTNSCITIYLLKYNSPRIGAVSRTSLNKKVRVPSGPTATLSSK